MISMRLIQGAVQAVRAVSKKFMRVDFEGLSEEEIEDRMLIQQYGLQSRPREGARLIALQQGEQIIVVGSDDKEYRMSLEDGDVVLYSKMDTFVKLGGSGGIEVSTQGGSFKMENNGNVNINNGALEVLA